VGAAAVAVLFRTDAERGATMALTVAAVMAVAASVLSFSRLRGHPPAVSPPPSEAVE
jgi:hypothetical protein